MFPGKSEALVGSGSQPAAGDLFVIGFSHALNSIKQAAESWPWSHRTQFFIGERFQMRLPFGFEFRVENVASAAAPVSVKWRSGCRAHPCCAVAGIDPPGPRPACAWPARSDTCHSGGQLRDHLRCWIVLDQVARAHVQRIELVRGRRDGLTPHLFRTTPGQCILRPSESRKETCVLC
jgi:hypothetical protein